ncbi:MAG: hypothetical protein ACI4PU_09950, partial [Intestinibacter sp.]
AVDGKKFTDEEVERLLKDTKIADDDFIKNVLGYGENPYGIMGADFKPMFTDKKIPINPTILEKRWLKSIIKDDMARLFLDENIISKLEDKLQDVEPLFKMDLKEKQNINDRFIKVIVCSFRYNKFIKYKFTYKEKEYEQIGMPFKLSYIPRENKFKLSVYCIEKRELFYIDLDSIKDIEFFEDLDEDLILLQKEVDAIGKREFFKKELSNQMVTLKMQIIPAIDSNTVERAHFLFSAYDKKSFKMKDHYILEVKYYKFDEENVIRKILNIGMYGIVLEPEEVKEKVVSMLLEGYNLQKRFDEEIGEKYFI